MWSRSRITILHKNWLPVWLRLEFMDIVTLNRTTFYKNIYIFVLIQKKNIFFKTWNTFNRQQSCHVELMRKLYIISYFRSKNIRCSHRSVHFQYRTYWKLKFWISNVLIFFQRRFYMKISLTFKFLRGIDSNLMK